MTRNSYAKLMTIMGLTMTSSMSNKDYFDLSSDTGYGYSTKRTERPKRGTKFTFDDGFECQALNKKNADRKYNNWLKARKEVKQ